MKENQIRSPQVEKNPQNINTDGGKKKLFEIAFWLADWRGIKSSNNEHVDLKRAVVLSEILDVYYKISNFINIKIDLFVSVSISLLLDTMFWRTCCWRTRNFTNRCQVIDGLFSFSRRTCFVGFLVNICHVVIWLQHRYCNHFPLASKKAVCHIDQIL